jgi:protein-S-isoprenylcysteine O-methyltransferase Ste14
VSAVRTFVAVGWLAFLLYWTLSALRAKRGTRGNPLRRPGVAVVLVILILRLLGLGGSDVHELALGVVGAALFAVGVTVAVWARVHLGRNWGMPMTLRDQPELVVTGPYRVVRHPIYSGILLALIGSALATNLSLLIVVAVLTAYFLYSATVEERDMTQAFPGAYASYREHTKMLIPFVV